MGGGDARVAGKASRKISSLVGNEIPFRGRGEKKKSLAPLLGRMRGHVRPRRLSKSSPWRALQLRVRWTRADLETQCSP